MNTNVSLPVDLARSITELLQKISTTFTPKEAEKAIVSDPLMNRLYCSLYAFTEKKGLAFGPDELLPCASVLTLSSKNGKDYKCDNQSGWSLLGEQITFNRDKKGALLSVKCGGSTLLPEDVFRKRIQAVTSPE